MRLLNYKYSEFEDLPYSWYMEKADFQNVNLLVGKNASGKTRVLNVMEALSVIILNSNNVLYSNGTFDANFSDGENVYNFKCKTQRQKSCL